MTNVRPVTRPRETIARSRSPTWCIFVLHERRGGSVRQRDPIADAVLSFLARVADLFDRRDADDRGHSG